MSDLYFIANPSLGIVKIGIADNPEQRRRGLECSCGVPLEILGVLRGGGHHEKMLHEAFDEVRLLGEWFNPTEEILRLAADPTSVPAYLEAQKPRIAARRAAKEAQAAIEQAAHHAAEEAHRAEMKRLRAEAKAKLAAQQARAQKRRDDKAAKQAAKIEAERVAWAAQHDAVVARVTRPEVVALVERRRLALSHQRTRNAVLLGVIPNETQRGASVGASEGR